MRKIYVVLEGIFSPRDNDFVWREVEKFEFRSQAGRLARTLQYGAIEARETIWLSLAVDAVKSGKDKPKDRYGNEFERASNA